MDKKMNIKRNINRAERERESDAPRKRTLLTQTYTTIITVFIISIFFPPLHSQCLGITVYFMLMPCTYFVFSLSFLSLFDCNDAAVRFHLQLGTLIARRENVRKTQQQLTPKTMIFFISSHK